MCSKSPRKQRPHPSPPDGPTPSLESAEGAAGVLDILANELVLLLLMESGILATINASLSTSTGLRNEPSAVVDAEAEASVDAKVFDLKQRFKQSGVTLPLEKQSGAVYRLGSRKLQLSIRNSRLTVRVGSSNFIDFLEYLSKAAI